MNFLTKTPYIIAEIGANHNGNYNMAIDMIDKAMECGADCVKFQIKMDPYELATKEHAENLNSGKVKLENVTNWESKELKLFNIFDQMKKFNFERSLYKDLIDYCNKIGIDVSASVFTKEGVDFIKDLNIAFIKVASMDIVNYDLLGYMFSTGIPVIASTGMASEEEIDRFVKYIPNGYESKTAILHCVSIYPPQEKNIQLNFIQALKMKYNLVVGYSDHSIGTLFPLLSIAFGAEIIEKHFTLDKNLPGWDHRVSADPEELKYICEMAGKVKSSLGGASKIVSEDEMIKRDKFRRSLTTKVNLYKGDILEEKHLTYKRPGNGIGVEFFEDVIGKKVNKDIETDKTIYWDDLT